MTLVPMVLAAGGAVDFTRYYDVRESLQTALDASVLAGATADNDETVASTTFASWNVQIDGSIDSPSYTPGETSDSSTLTGTVKAHLNMYFTALAGLSNLTLTVTSKAARSITESTGGTCVWLINPSGTGLWANSGSKFTTDCEIDVFSPSATGTEINSGAYLVTPKLCVEAASLDISRGSVTDPDTSATTLNLDCSPTDYARTLPTPATGTCIYPGNYNSGNTYTLYPGTYCGTFNFNSGTTIVFSPGVYVFKGAVFNLNSTASGTGVTFYFSDSSSYIQMNSGCQTTFSAPTSGDYEGILMYEPSGLSRSSTVAFSGNGNTNTWSGLIYLPSWAAEINSGSKVALTGGLVLKNMIVDGGANGWTVENDLDASGSTYSIARLVK